MLKEKQECAPGSALWIGIELSQQICISFKRQSAKLGFEFPYLKSPAPDLLFSDSMKVGTNI